MPDDAIDMTTRHTLTRAITWVILIAAIVSAPVFLFAESFDAHHALLVLGSNGVCVVLCAFLLHHLRKGRVDFCAHTLVFGLLLVVGILASTNGEDVHVNVVNFLLVTVLASVLLNARALVIVTVISSLTMLGIAWSTTVAPEGEGLAEARLESIGQFLPTYLVIATVLWLRERGGRAISRSEG